MFCIALLGYVFCFAFLLTAAHCLAVSRRYLYFCFTSTSCPLLCLKVFFSVFATAPCIWLSDDISSFVLRPHFVFCFRMISLFLSYDDIFSCVLRRKFIIFSRQHFSSCLRQHLFCGSRRHIWLFFRCSTTFFVKQIHICLLYESPFLYVLP